jgi:hypothetical protein
MSLASSRTFSPVVIGLALVLVTGCSDSSLSTLETGADAVTTSLTDAATSSSRAVALGVSAGAACPLTAGEVSAAVERLMEEKTPDDPIGICQFFPPGAVDPENLGLLIKLGPASPDIDSSTEDLAQGLAGQDGFRFIEDLGPAAFAYNVPASSAQFVTFSGDDGGIYHMSVADVGRRESYDQLGVYVDRLVELLVD